MKIRNVFEKLLNKPTRSDTMDTIKPETDIDIMPTVPEELPLLPLKDTVVYPLTVYPLVIGKEKSIKLINEVAVGDKILGLTSQKRADIEVTGLDDVYSIGTMARILQMIKIPDGTLRVLVQGIERISILNLTQNEPYIRARTKALPDIIDKSVETEALMRGLSETFQKLVLLTPNMPEELSAAAVNIDNPRQLAYLIATNIRPRLAKPIVKTFNIFLNMC